MSEVSGVIRKVYVVPDGSPVFPIDVSTLPPGMYFCELVDPNGLKPGAVKVIKVCRPLFNAPQEPGRSRF